jgi:hypothetical protein
MKNFTIKVEFDYYNDPEGDKEREKAIRTGVFPVPVGGFWRYSISEILDHSTGKDLATVSVLQIEDKELKNLIKDLFNRLPRFLDENGLRSK